ncbi:hypothetical protein E2562_008831 [Oryza meyeriana var. granulata]|uniref:Uncharacterized protein n=1 Tax=Oryza meyeriana var. granulata TaxID=110450 RepID=A0A6G1D0C9_9ORYZ|nr:hypothetical protein E2562_008831 [Oryza meyeriana var. granulata]
MIECAQGEAERQLEKLPECAEHGRKELLADVLYIVKFRPVVKGEDDDDELDKNAGLTLLLMS